MKKTIDKIKKDIADEAMKSGLVVLGAVGGMFAAGALRKATEDNPTINAVVKYGLPVLMAGGGLIIAAATDDKNKAKYFGYGLAVAGTVEGVKLIPIAQDYLKGILGETEIPASTAFLTEVEERQKLMSGFGLGELPIGSASLQTVGNYQTNLPELDNMNGLGYNSSATDDVDPLKGMGYNSSATDDVDPMSGII